MCRGFHSTSQHPDVELFSIYQQLLLRENIILVRSEANAFLFLSKVYCLLTIKGWTLAENDMAQHLRGSNTVKQRKQGKINDNWQESKWTHFFFPNERHKNMLSMQWYLYNLKMQINEPGERLRQSYSFLNRTPLRVHWRLAHHHTNRLGITICQYSYYFWKSKANNKYISPKLSFSAKGSRLCSGHSLAL